MIFGAVLLAGAIAAGLLLLSAIQKGWPAEPFWQSGLRLGFFIAGARIAILWAVFLLGDASGWHQAAGYIALVVDAVVELGLASAWLDDLFSWRLALTGLVLLTSLGIGVVLAYLGSWLRVFLEQDTLD